VTVVLNGDGGDELLAGYPRYDVTGFDRLASRYFPDDARERLCDLLARVPSGLPGSGLLRHRLARMIAPFSRAYLGRICYFSPEEKERLYAPEFCETVKGHDSYDLLARWFEEIPASDLLDRMLGVDTRSYLPDDLLVKVDRATMAHGLEARSPFLDHRLVEFAASLPVDLKVRNGQPKYLLKVAMRGILPDRILDRDKMGFGVPIDRWFRQDCREFLRDILLSTRCMQRGYFRPERVRQMVDDHQYAGTDYGYRLYALLMLELWHREYMDGARA
jgi:asparagine synthase (glutamine-hydrolysing)